MQIISQLINAAITILIAALVWAYYRNKKFPMAERYATFWPRFWTGDVDKCIFLPLTLLTCMVPYLTSRESELMMALSLVETLFLMLYTILMHGRYGQTVGKMITKVQVVDNSTESSISYRQACLREGLPFVLWLGAFAYQINALCSGSLVMGDPQTYKQLLNSPFFKISLSIPALWFGAEIITMLTNKKRRALHDLIAGTVVVRTNIAEAPAVLDNQGTAGAARPADETFY